MPKQQDSEKQSFLLSAFILGISMALVKIIGAFFKIPLMNLLGETGMAYFSSAYSVFTAVYAVTVSGLTSAISRMVSSFDSAKRTADKKRLRRCAFFLYTCIGLCGAAAMYFGASFFAEQIACPMAESAIAASSLSILFCCCMAAFRGYYEGLCNMKPTAVSQVVEAVGKLIFGLAGVYFVLRRAKYDFLAGGSVFGQSVSSLEQAVNAAMPYAAAAAMLGISLSTLMGLCYLMVYHLRHTGNEKIASPIQSLSIKSLVKELLAAAFPITAATLMMQLMSLIDTATVMNELSKFFSAHSMEQNQIKSVLDAGETPEVFCFGVFSACVTLYNLIPNVVGLLSKAALPAVTRIYSLGNRESLQKQVQSVLICSCYVTFPASFGMAAIAKQILQVLYSRQPNTAVYGERILQFLGIGALFCGIILPLSAVFQAGKRFWIPVLCQGVGVVVKLAGNLIFIFPAGFGVSGAALATLAGHIATAGMLMLYAQKHYGLSENGRQKKLSLAGPLLRILIISVVSGMSAYFSAGFLAQTAYSKALALAISMLLAAVCYLLGTMLLKPLKKEAVNMLASGKKLAKVLEKFKIIE